MARKELSTRLFCLLIGFFTVAAVVVTLSACVSDREKVSEGKKNIIVYVVDDKGERSVYHIETECKYLRGAIEKELNLEGDESEFGLYVKKVNGVLADFEKNGAYWSFSKNGELLMTGIDTAIISDGDTFDIVYTK